MRVDVSLSSSIDEAGKVAEKRVDVWQTFRGNEWDNKGEKLGGGTLVEGGVKVNIGVLGARDFYEARQGCQCLSIQAFGAGSQITENLLTSGIVSPLSLLKNPMILIGGLGMLLMFGMPKIMENSESPRLRINRVNEIPR